MQLLILSAIVICGWFALYLALRQSAKKEYARVCRQVDAQALSVRNGELRSEIGKLQAKLAAEVTGVDAGIKSRDGKAVQSSQEIAPETLVAITEALTCLFGKKVRVLSAVALPVFPGIGQHPILWTQQGRMHIHASHEVVQRGF